MKVVLAVNGLGLGGTEKVAQVHALALDRSRYDVRVVAALADGVRRVPLEEAGIEVACADGDRSRLAELFQGADLVHVIRAGVAEPLAPSACRDAGVELLVSSNVFGAVDASPDEAMFACHLLPSKMCALRYRRRLGLEGSEFHARHRVSHWPVDAEGLRGLAPDPAEAKSSLGLDPERPVVGRVGRANDRKWRNLLVDMVPPLLELAPHVQVALVGPTPARLRRLDRLGVLDRVRLFQPTADERAVATMYAACDVFVTAAEIGESHSVSIEEAMCLGLPVVTCSTPWVDNGQIEQVEEGVTGHVANHPRPFAEAVASLVSDSGKRRRFGRAAEEKASALYDAGRLTRQLERLYESLSRGQGPPDEWFPSPAEVDAFADEYERRLAACYRPLSAAERREERLERLGERGGWAVRAARTSLNREGLSYAAGVVRARLGGVRR
jgi:glycosyltransferase involved in cell wall biosynthesis